MICPDTDFDCDNPGCRHGGCQGRRPELPLLRLQNSPRLAEQTSQAPLPRAYPTSFLPQSSPAP